MRIAVVEKDRCQPRKCNFECHHFCPVVRQGKPCVWKSEETGKAAISETLCIGCNICVVKCPFDAIHIINLPEALETDLIQQFGENGFRLFRLPVPKAGSIVGLLGPNGIGKTTAIKTLSGQEAPNLGAYQRAAEWTQAVEKYRGTELGDYLAKVAARQVKAAFKPQYVDRLGRVAQGKVRDLLAKVDERGALEAVTRELDIHRILDHDIGSLSGGELQRVAIAATLLREAEVYFFDEPSSYLDIFQRLRAARLIRRLAEEQGKAVVVIEHDLAVLDFLADQVHLLYGKEAAFGVVALPRPVRSAINTYLSGFMREENIRFRDNEIRFEAHPPRAQWQTETLLEFPALRKRLGEFDLEATGGVIRQGEVVGVVGPNATGKTTFVKMLAGELKPDAGQVATGVRVSYKPQYVKSDEEGSVEFLLNSTLGPRSSDTFFQAEIARPLGFERLRAKEMAKLSGGELQRVALMLALAREADLYLLDEPSAYLDSEQRMVAAKTIRRVMEKTGKSALVVDHDVYFIDLISDGLMVFGGEPGRKGVAQGPFELREGMNRFLASVDITFRRDKESLRPRVNKPGSGKDREQRSAGEYYYAPAEAKATEE